MTERVERLANLVAFLAHTGRPVSFAEIVGEVPGYDGGSKEAVRKTFERDKRILREESGIAITVDENDRYTIRREDLYLPDLELTDDERAALAVAAAAVPVADASRALRNLGGVDPGRLAEVTVRADLDVSPLLPVLHGATRRHTVVRFDHGGKERTVEPYGLLFRDGNWYVHGRERTVGEARTFRVDRIESDVVVLDEHFDPPPDLDLRAVMPREPWLIGGGGTVGARVLVDAVLAGKVAAEVGDERVVERRPDGAIVVELPVSNVGAFRSWVLGLLDRAEVLSPPELREDVVAWLEAMAGAR